MGAMKNAKQERKDARRPTGSVLGNADWSRVDAAAMRAAVARSSACGGALRFGYTRDGGAYAIGIYGLGAPYTAYLRPSDDMEAFLREIMSAFEELGDAEQDKSAHP